MAFHPFVKTTARSAAQVGPMQPLAPVEASATTDPADCPSVLPQKRKVDSMLHSEASNESVEVSGLSAVAQSSSSGSTSTDEHAHLFSSPFGGTASLHSQSSCTDGVLVPRSSSNSVVDDDASPLSQPVDTVTAWQPLDMAPSSSAAAAEVGVSVLDGALSATSSRSVRRKVASSAEALDQSANHQPEPDNAGVTMINSAMAPSVSEHTSSAAATSALRRRNPALTDIEAQLFSPPHTIDAPHRVTSQLNESHLRHNDTAAHELLCDEDLGSVSFGGSGSQSPASPRPVSLHPLTDTSALPEMATSSATAVEITQHAHGDTKRRLHPSPIAASVDVSAQPVLITAPVIPAAVSVVLVSTPAPVSLTSSMAPKMSLGMSSGMTSASASPAAMSPPAPVLIARTLQLAHVPTRLPSAPNGSIATAVPNKSCPHFMPPTEAVTMNALTIEVSEDMFEREKYAMANPKYFELRQPHLTPRMRAVVFDWMMEVAQEFYLGRETFHLAVQMFDRYLSFTCDVPRNMAQLLGVTALWVAAKLEEMVPPPAADFLLTTDSAYSLDQMKEMERDILVKLNYNVLGQTPYSFMLLLLRRAAHRLKEECNNLNSPRPFRVTNSPTGVADVSLQEVLDSVLSTQYFLRCCELMDVAILDTRCLELKPSALAACVVVAVHPGLVGLLPLISPYHYNTLPAIKSFMIQLHYSLPFRGLMLPIRPFYKVSLKPEDYYTRQLHHTTCLRAVGYDSIHVLPPQNNPPQKTGVTQTAVTRTSSD